MAKKTKKKKFYHETIVSLYFPTSQRHYTDLYFLRGRPLTRHITIDPL